MIGLVRCDRCHERISVKLVVGPHRAVRLCQDCLDLWHSFRALIYGGDAKGEIECNPTLLR